MTQKVCPRCGGFVRRSVPVDGDGTVTVELMGAISRRDNDTEICSDCGIKEAFEDLGALPKWDGPAYWKEKKDGS